MNYDKMYPNDGQFELLSSKALSCLFLVSTVIFSGGCFIFGFVFGVWLFAGVALLAIIVACCSIIATASNKPPLVTMLLNIAACVLWFFALTNLFNNF